MVYKRSYLFVKKTKVYGSLLIILSKIKKILKYQSVILT